MKVLFFPLKTQIFQKHSCRFEPRSVTVSVSTGLLSPTTDISRQQKQPHYVVVVHSSGDVRYYTSNDELYATSGNHTVTEAICPQPDAKSGDLDTDEVEAQR